MSDTEIMLPPVLPYGTWPSPVSAADVARTRHVVSFPLVHGKDVWWQERLPDEGGRSTVIHLGPDGQRRTMLPAPWSARTRVHEYGGLSYLPVPAEKGSTRRLAFVFANESDQRLYLARPGAAGEPTRNAGEPTRNAGEPADREPRPLTPHSGSGAEAALRYADFTLSPDASEVWCVQESHSDGKVTRSIVAVPLDGSAAEDPAGLRQIVTGSDFFAFPTPSPDGRMLAWVTWNHPRMPWDGTELRVAVLEDGVAGKSRLIKGGMRESVLAPLWRDSTGIYAVTDWPGWWNIYELDLAGVPPQALCPAEEEFASPLWQLGSRPFAMLGDGRLAVTHGQGGMRLAVLDPKTAELTDLEIGFPAICSGLSADGDTVVCVAGGPDRPLSLVRVEVSAARTQVLCQEENALPDVAYLPVPRPVTLSGRFGRTVHAIVYPPANPEVSAPQEERPPYIVWVHAGPTTHTLPLLDCEKAYFTSRGIGIVDVNYGGSSGYGRSYRERLRRQWGLVDVEDVVAAALALTEESGADRNRLAVRGGSAGGWTALGAVTTHASGEVVFRAATSYYGIADLRGFAAQTHDFEAHYIDGLIGPLPAYQPVWEERAPLGHVSEHTCPILLLHGLEDPIVPPGQSRSIAAELADRGIRHRLIEFEGESHGFRMAETIVACLEAELSFYGQALGFIPPGIPELNLDCG
jgi:dipeptidyl aminopeptidase/acylaminoacyl peptidase